MAVWPSTLPKIAVDTQEARQDGTIRTPMGTGPAKSRRRFSAVSRYLTTSLLLTAEQRETFDDFFSDTLAEGSLEFDMEDPKDGATVQMRFTGPPSYNYAGGNNGRVTVCVVSLNLEILP